MDGSVSQQLGQLQGKLQGVEQRLDDLMKQQDRDHDTVKASIKETEAKAAKNDHDSRNRDQAQINKIEEVKVRVELDMEKLAQAISTSTREAIQHADHRFGELHALLTDSERGFVPRKDVDERFAAIHSDIDSINRDRTKVRTIGGVVLAVILAVGWAAHSFGDLILGMFKK